MQLRDGELRFSPSDLSAHLACTHLTQLELAVAHGELKRPVFDDPHADLIRRKGNEHEAAYLGRLEVAGKNIVRIPTYDDPGFDAAEARRLTEEAIRAGEADVIYQPYLTDGTWRGFADFLERLPDSSYEPVDTKLARTAKPAHVLQLCFYAEQVERIQARPVEHVHVELGSGERETFRVAEYAAYYRRVRERFLEAVGGSGRGEPRPYEDGGGAERGAKTGDSPLDMSFRADGGDRSGNGTYPWPCDHCSICAWRRECHQRLVADDNVVLVAGLGRSYVERLGAGGITTLERLGEVRNGSVPDGIRAETFEGLRHQAELQLHRRRTGEHRWDLLPPAEERGFQLLPAPDEGDVWLDLEGHPFFEPARGLEYLFGYCYRDDAGEVRHEALWARDRAEERAVFERFVDWVVGRRRRHPGLHVYHYAAYERTALRRLMGEHGTREDEIDDFLRQEVLVDLYRVVKQALRASVDSYSIKKVEELYGFERTADVHGGDESTVQFEAWLETGDDTLLEQVERYNEEDCRSTFALHEWLLELRPRDLPWRTPPDERERTPEAEERDTERAAVRSQLLGRSAGEGDTWWLLAQLLDYHEREQKPQWWEYFRHLEYEQHELIDDPTTLGGLELDREPVREKRSLVYRLSYPEQEHKIRGRAMDPVTGKTYAVEVFDELGFVELSRSADRADEPLPRALIPGRPIADWVKRDAVLRFANACLARGPGEPGPYEALWDVVCRQPPRADLALSPTDAARSLDRSYLFVQGPPGAGKTWHGAKIALALMRDGRRVGVTALSHTAIHNLLQAIEAEADRQGVAFKGLKKCGDVEDDTAFTGLGFIENTEKNDDLLADELSLVAGTGWVFSRPELEGHVDTLIVDEAGQVALADAIASGVAARNLVLLGDPNQLPQVSQGLQPEQARASVLQHLLGGEPTVSADRGIFLAETWRLRPEPCAFTSEAYYVGRLAPAPTCATRSLGAGNGLHVLAVDHAGRSQSSWEEADAVGAAIRALLGTPFTDGGGTRPLAPADVLVVAPYNAQVRALRARVPEGVRVGTVDKFQGQEAPVVFVSFASSSGEEAPRGIRFAFDRHRVNVATSRAQCRVVLVCSPRLLEADCRTVEEMRLLNAVCRFVELAGAGA